jgi:hypothetical protein
MLTEKHFNLSDRTDIQNKKKIAIENSPSILNMSKDELNIIENNILSLYNINYYKPFNYSDNSELIEKYIINLIRYEKIFNIQIKVLISNLILMNNNLFINFNDFFEEECHLSLLNWVFNEKIFLKNNNLNNNNINNKFNLFLQLLNNVLNIFLSLPINSNDILNLKMFQRLKNIKYYISLWNNINIKNYYINLINQILNIWKEKVEINFNSFLNIKRNRDFNKDKFYLKEDTEADSYDNDSIIYEKELKIKNKKNGKTLKFDLSKNKKIIFNKEDEPIKISYLLKEQKEK